MASIADVYVTVLPETSKIKEGIRREFRSVDNDAREAGRRWGREIRSGMGDVGVRVEGDIQPAQREVRKLDHEIEGRTRKMHVEVDREGLQKSATMLRASHTNLIAAAVVGGTLFAPQTIAATGTAVAQLSGSIALLPAVLGAAGLAFGSLKIATLGFGDALKEIRDPEKFAEAIGQISPNMQEAARSIQGLLPEVDKLKFTVQDAFGAGLGESIQQLGSTYLPMFRTVMSQMASSASTALKDTGAMLMSPERQGDMQAMTGNMAAGFDRLSQALSPIVSAFVDIGLVGSGFLPRLADAATKAAQAFSDFITEARNSGDLQAWIDGGIEAFKQLGRIVGDIGGIIKAFMTAAPEGGGLLGTIEQITQTINDFLNSAGGQQALNTWMTAMQSAMTALAPAAGALLQALAPLASLIGQTLGEAIVAIAPALTTWFTAMQPVTQQLAGALLPVIQQIMPVIGQLAMVLADQMVSGIQQILPVLVPFVGQMGQLLVALTPLLPPMLQLVTAALPMMQQVVAAILPPLTQFATILTNLANLVVPPLTAAVGALGDSFASKFTIISGVVTTVWNSVQGPLNAMKTAIDALTQPLQRLMELASRIPGVSAFVTGGSIVAGAAGSALTSSPAVMPVPAFGQTSPLPNASRERRGLAPVAPAVGVPMTALPVPAVSGYVAPVIPSSGGGSSAGGFSDSGLRPNAAALNDIIAAQFPEITEIGGYRANGGGSSDHPSGRALDIMIPGWDTPEGKALGDQINQFLHQNADQLGIDSTIWQDFWKPVGGEGNFLGRKGANEGHYNHIHAKTRDELAAGGPMTFPGSPLSSAYPSSEFTPTGDPAFDRKGRDAQQKVDDKADAVTRAQMKYDQVLANGKSTALQRKTAEDALKRAKREHADAQEDLNSLLEKGNTLEQGGAGSTGGEQLGQDIVSGMLDVFGFGDLFKDPTQFGLFKGFKGVMSAMFGGGQTEGGGGSDLFGGGGGGGPGGILGALMSNVPSPFGDLNIGSPKDAPGQFMPGRRGSGGSAAQAIINPMAHGGQQGAPPGPGINNDFRGANFGHSPTVVQDQVHSAGLRAMRQPVRALP